MKTYLLIFLALAVFADVEVKDEPKTRLLYGAATCPAGMCMSDAGICTQCHAQIPGCLSCTSPTICTSCAPGYTLANGMCTPIGTQCMDGSYWDPITNACISCGLSIPNCALCTSATSCTSCLPGFLLQSGLCVMSTLGVGAAYGGVYSTPVAYRAAYNPYAYSAAVYNPYAAGVYNTAVYNPALVGTGLNAAAAYGTGLYGAGLYGAGLYGAAAACGTLNYGYGAYASPAVTPLVPSYSGVTGVYPAYSGVGYGYAAPVAYSAYANPVAYAAAASPYVYGTVGGVYAGTPLGGTRIGGVSAVRPLTTQENPGQCAHGEYKGADGKCAQCNPTCGECIGPGADQCIACPANSSFQRSEGKLTGVCVCNPGTIFDIASKSCIGNVRP